MADDGTTIGVWIGPGDQQLVEEFDAVHNGGDGTYSRSEAIKDAMRLAVSIEETMAEAGLEHLDGRGRAAFVRQAILDEARRQRSDGE
jgi:hypothetical protein